MAVLELYGKCKQLGYCDCRGFFGCVDPRPPAPKPVIENELKNAMEAERELSDYKNHNLKHELALVECEVCDKSHLPDHPHITNIDGDALIDDEPQQQKSAPVIQLPPSLPDWLKDKPGSEAIRPATNRVAETLCKLCGNPWAPKHVCNVPEPQDRLRLKQKQTTCEDCGKVKRSNHACKGQNQVNPSTKKPEQCQYCEASGELCVRHGGLQSDYETPRGDERVAKTLPAAVSVMQSEGTHNCRKGHPRTPENTYIRSDGRRECKECKRDYRSNWRPAVPTEVDSELAAIGAILNAVEGLESNQLRRVMSYVAARIEGAE